MPSHPIEERAISHTAEWNSWEEPQIFRDGAKWGYDQALADRAKVDAARRVKWTLEMFKALELIEKFQCGGPDSLVGDASDILHMVYGEVSAVENVKQIELHQKVDAAKDAIVSFSEKWPGVGAIGVPCIDENCKRPACELARLLAALDAAKQEAGHG